MSFKVVRNLAGVVVAFGPNDDQYDPGEVEGRVVTIEDEAPALSTVPQIVTMHQARRALALAGLYDEVNAAIAGMTGQGGTLARIDWDYAPTVQRHNDLVKALAPALGLTDVQLDALFVAAAAL